RTFHFAGNQLDIFNEKSRIVRWKVRMDGDREEGWGRDIRHRRSSRFPFIISRNLCKTPERSLLLVISLVCSMKCPAWHRRAGIPDGWPGGGLLRSGDAAPAAT